MFLKIMFGLIFITMQIYIWYEMHKQTQAIKALNRKIVINERLESYVIHTMHKQTQAIKALNRKIVLNERLESYVIHTHDMIENTNGLVEQINVKLTEKLELNKLPTEVPKLKLPSRKKDS